MRGHGMRATGVASLPLHPGNAPRWLFKRMVSLSSAMMEVMVEEEGTGFLLQRMSNPYWFQALSCVLGFDWHSSGTTTVTCGALKEAMKGSELGVIGVGGKGRASRKAPQGIEEAAKVLELSEQQAHTHVRTSKLTAKIDSAALQDGFELYHHAFFLDGEGNWAVVQQGLCNESGYARRYHWSNASDFFSSPHSGIACDEKRNQVLNLSHENSQGNRKIMLDLVNDSPMKLKPAHHKLLHPYQSNLFDDFHEPMEPLPHLKMPRNVNWNALQQVYEIQPSRFEDLVMERGIGAGTVRALSYISTLLYGDEPDWKDPVKFSFAVGGKDGVPFPVDRKAMDQAAIELKTALEESRVNNKERLKGIERLREFLPEDYEWQ